MKPLAAIAVVAWSFGLAGCGGDDAAQRPDNAAPPAANAMGSAAASPGDRAAAPPHADNDGMRWNFSRTAAGPRLAYGEPATDDVRLMLRCPPGGDTVLLTFHRPRELAEAQPGEIVIEAGGEVHRSTIDVRESQLGGSTIEAQAPVSAGPFRRMRAGLPLTLHWGDRAVSVPAGGARQDQVNAFFEACGPF